MSTAMWGLGQQTRRIPADCLHEIGFRQVSSKNSSGQLAHSSAALSAGAGNLVVEMEFVLIDGRRIVRDDGTTAEHFFYDNQQVVETRVPDGGDLVPNKQYVWSLRYVDSPILRDAF